MTSLLECRWRRLLGQLSLSYGMVGAFRSNSCTKKLPTPLASFQAAQILSILSVSDGLCEEAGKFFYSLVPKNNKQFQCLSPSRYRLSSLNFGRQVLRSHRFAKFCFSTSSSCKVAFSYSFALPIGRAGSPKHSSAR